LNTEVKILTTEAMAFLGFPTCDELRWQDSGADGSGLQLSARSTPIILLSCLKDVRVHSWLDAALAHDPYLHIHSICVGLLTGDFASFLGLSARDSEELVEAALLHDIGKLSLSRALLQKPGPLTPLEWSEMKRHPHLGAALLRKMDVWTDLTIDVAAKHHERLDGTGYPLGLRANVIGEAVRMVTICDVFTAMMESRPYAEALTWDAALAVLARQRSRLDMQLVREFTHMVEAKML